MSKSFISVLTILSFLGVLTLFYFQSTHKVKIAYVDNAVLMSKYTGMIDARKEFEGKSSGWQSNIDTLAKEFENELKAYEKERSTMSAKEKTLKEELLNTKQQQFMQYRDAMQKKYKDEEDKISGEAVKILNGYIQDYGKQNNFKIIIGANNTGNVLFAAKEMDITEAVLTYVNSVYTKK